MMRLFLALAMLAATVIGVDACQNAQADSPDERGPPVSMYLQQDPDSARWVMSWRPGPIVQPRQAAITAWHVQLMERLTIDSAGATWDTIVTQVLDSTRRSATLAMAYPAFGDTVWVRGRVKAVDERGLESTFKWSVGGAQELTLPPLPPSEPDTVYLDPDVVALYLVPEDTTVAPLQVIQFCTFAEMSDGRIGVVRNHWDIPECFDALYAFRELRYVLAPDWIDKLLKRPLEEVISLL
jgi:hypothetical protein